VCVSKMDDFDVDEGPKILFLRGVFVPKKRSIDDVFYQELSAGSKTETIVYNKCPRQFYSLETWPQTTNLHCLQCDNQIKGVPKPIPISMQIVGKQKTFKVEGVTCEFPCMARLINKLPSKHRWQRHQLMLILFQIFYSKSVTDVPESPDIMEQSRFGIGPLSENAFRQKNKAIVDGLLNED
jgi:hypothetical protein